MTEIYRLMHKSSLCGILMFETESGALLDYKPAADPFSPFLNNATQTQPYS